MRAAKPDCVWELFAGADALTFLKQFASYKPGGQLLTNGLDELFTTAVDGANVEGIIVNQSYFSSLQTPANEAFLANYQAKFGAGKYVNAIAEATYIATWLYAKAVEKADSADTEKVIDAMARSLFRGATGTGVIRRWQQSLGDQQHYRPLPIGWSLRHYRELRRHRAHRSGLQAGLTRPASKRPTAPPPAVWRGSRPVPDEA